MDSKNTERESLNPSAVDIISRVVNMLKIEHSLTSLQDALAMLTEIEEKKRNKKVIKLLAEINYLIAIEYRKVGKHQEMLQHAEISVDLYKRCNISTLEDSIPILSELLPDYMHDGVVQSRLLKEGLGGSA